MKTCYYTIVCRPEGSKCWTPYPCEKDRDVGNFFASIRQAMDYIKSHADATAWIPRLHASVPYQFKVARVVIANNLPDNPNPEHS